jgi:hypothetical protein
MAAQSSGQGQSRRLAGMHGVKVRPTNVIGDMHRADAPNNVDCEQ